MCVVNDINNPRRRHRPAYFAPARSLANEDGGAVDEEDASEAVPVAQFETSIGAEVANDPSEDYQQIISFHKALAGLFRSLIDLGLLVVIMFVSFFLYDVEINIIQAGGDDRTILSTNNNDVIMGSRVIIRNEVQSPSSPTRQRFDGIV